MSLEGRMLSIGTEQLEVEHFLGASDMPEELDLDAFSGASGQSTIGRRAIIRGAEILSITPDAISPSALEEREAGDVGAEIISYSSAWEIDKQYAGAEFGTLVHRFFELGSAGDAVKERLAQNALSEGISEELIAQIRGRVDDFETWMNGFFPVQAVQRELPILALTDQGTLMNGLVDLVVETKKGIWIIDHKSDQIEDSLTAFGKYQAQLGAYADALGKSGENVLGVAIHWIRNGDVVLQRF